MRHSASAKRITRSARLPTCGSSSNDIRPAKADRWAQSGIVQAAIHKVRGTTRDSALKIFLTRPGERLSLGQHAPDFVSLRLSCDPHRLQGMIGNCLTAAKRARSPVHIGERPDHDMLAIVETSFGGIP
jgi:hypothetical protein